MSEIPLTRGMIAIIDDEDVELVCHYKWYASWSGRHWYAAYGSGKNMLRMHQLIMGSNNVDHIDGDGLNNKRTNLRAATKAQNAYNTGLRSHNTSGYKGVSKIRTRANAWEARIQVRGHSIYLGYYKSPEDAARAYDAAAKTYHGEYAQLNFPEGTS